MLRSTNQGLTGLNSRCHQGSIASQGSREQPIFSRFPASRCCPCSLNHGPLPANTYIIHISASIFTCPSLIGSFASFFLRARVIRLGLPRQSQIISLPQDPYSNHLFKITFAFILIGFRDYEVNICVSVCGGGGGRYFTYHEILGF